MAASRSSPLRPLDPVPEKDQNRLSLWSEMGNQIDYYFIRGENMDEVISGYRTVTGKSQVMPKWAMGILAKPRAIPHAG